MPKAPPDDVCRELLGLGIDEEDEFLDSQSDGDAKEKTMAPNNSLDYDEVERKLRAVFAKLDVRKTGGISRVKFIAGLSQDVSARTLLGLTPSNRPVGSELNDLWNKIDLRNDGVISFDELKYYYKARHGM